ncbi:MAG: hypothetical protein IKM30_03800 [Oscillospiraceae bacterium]|nr:hypothetical protein [Oscillospiraceae bacterium]
MEQKHTLTIILSCILVCALIFFGRLAKKEDTDLQTDPSETTPTVMSPQEGITTTTNFWDFLREQDAATATTTALQTDENGNFVTTAPATDENGNFVTQAPATDENGNAVGSTAGRNPSGTTTETTTTMPVFLAPVS